MGEQYRVLLVDDEEGVRLMLGALLRQDGYLVEAAASHTEAMELVGRYHFHLAFVDITLKGANGIQVLKDLKKHDPLMPVIMFTGNPDVDTAATAVRLGAFDYIVKPVRHETLKAVTRLAITSRCLEEERERNRANLDAIFRSVNDAIIMVDSQGRVVQFNAAAAAACGYGADSIGCSLEDIHLGCSGKCQHLILTALEDHATCRQNRIECHKTDGTVRLVNFMVSPVTENDASVTGYVAVIRDETRIDTLEKTLQGRSIFHRIIGCAPAMQKLYSLTEALMDVQTTVLINGESGTGKELFAAALHHGGSRRNGPFVKVNCSALSENLLESELFGHVRGAFTGAVTSKAGRFEKAHGGTIFLDEIGDISPGMQMRLLRVLQENEFERVGDSSPVKVDVRVVAATNRDLAELVRKGVFRQDLYYRLNVVRMVLPPLRERVEDIPLLARHFLKHFSERFGKTVQGFSDDVMALFQKYGWPGNIRELKHTIEHACLLCPQEIITLKDLSPDLLFKQATPLAPTEPPRKQPLSLEEALAMTDGNKARAARLLGISRRTIYRHLGE